MCMKWIKLISMYPRSEPYLAYTYSVFIFEGLCGSEDKALVFSKNVDILYSLHQPFSRQQKERSLSLSTKKTQIDILFIVFHSYNIQKKINTVS